MIYGIDMDDKFLKIAVGGNGFIVSAIPSRESWYILESDY